MTNHLFKTGFGQCRCLWCHSPFRSPGCPVDDEVRIAVKAFAHKHGRTWKSALRKLWTSGKDEGPLRQARNMIGPSGLDRISQSVLERVNLPTPLT